MENVKTFGEEFQELTDELLSVKAQIVALTSRQTEIECELALMENPLLRTFQQRNIEQDYSNNPRFRRLDNLNDFSEHINNRIR